MPKEKKPYSDRRWWEPIYGITTGHVEVSEEERAAALKIVAQIMMEEGLIKSEDELHPVDESFYTEKKYLENFQPRRHDEND